LDRKPYLSIIRLLEHCGIEYDGAINISRLKKILLAEFGLSPTGIITIEQHSYNKNDIIAEIENTDFSNRLQWHIAIWQCKNVCRFLELDVLHTDELKEEISVFKENDWFKKFISPQLAVAFNYFTRNIVYRKDMEAIRRLLFLNDFLLPEHRVVAFSSLRLFFDEQIKLLRNTTKDSFKLMRPKIKHWAFKRWYKCFNQLPHEFYQQQYDIVFYLIHVTVNIQHRNPHTCYGISRQLTKVKGMPEEISTLIKKNHKIYRASAEQVFTFLIIEIPVVCRSVLKLFSIITKKIRRYFEPAVSQVKH
jgi:hypothetical protein